MRIYSGTVLLPELNAKDIGFHAFAVSAVIIWPDPQETVTLVADCGKTETDRTWLVFGYGFGNV